MIILLGGSKGGVGKTTIVINLSIMRGIMGRSVIIFDVDPNKTLTRFFELREDKKIFPIPRTLEKRGKYIHTEIENARISGVDTLFIDAGGFDSPEFRSTLSHPQVMAYAPLQPGMLDLLTVEGLDEIVSMAKLNNENLKMKLLFNRCSTHLGNSSLQEAKKTVQSFDNLILSENHLCQRTNFQDCFSESLSIVEYEDAMIQHLPSYQSRKFVPKASLEMIALYEKVFDEKFTAYPIFENYKEWRQHAKSEF